jgi:outer membrane protein assembly factor BamE
MRLVLILSIFLISCSHQNSVPEFLPKVYKMDVNQGNEIDSVMLLKLKPGMTQSQVRFVLGTPLIQDSFHKQRWDYLYVMRKDGKLVEKRHIILNFEKNLLKNITGEVIPKKDNRQAVNAEKNDDSNYGQDKNEINNNKASWLEKYKFWKEDISAAADKNTNDEINSTSNAEQVLDNADFIQEIDITESINEAVKSDIESNKSEGLSGDNLNYKKSQSEDKEVIINQEVEKKEPDYFKLILEKIGF